MVCSQVFSDEQCSNLWSASEYNSNNAWIFNANNGNLNNNNKMNGNSCRGSLEFGFDNGDDKDTLIYLARIIFQSMPQAHCIRKSQPFMWDGLSQDKSLLHRNDGVGIPIGNVTSQMMCNFVTTAILFFLAKFGIRFVHYTDDNAGAVADKADFLKTMKLLKAFVAEDLHLQIHRRPVR